MRTRGSYRRNLSKDMHVYIHLCVCVYIYIHSERDPYEQTTNLDREGERHIRLYEQMENNVCLNAKSM